jgi:hypothetical protein
MDDQSAVPPRQLAVLEERGGRQEHVGVMRRVGAHLVVDDGEEVLALEPATHALLVGRGGERVRVVDEERLDRGRVELEQRRAELVHVDGAGRRLALPHRGCVVELPRARVAERVAAAAHAELAGDRRQREHRRHRRAAVAIALHPPATADHRR